LFVCLFVCLLTTSVLHVSDLDFPLDLYDVAGLQWWFRNVFFLFKGRWKTCVHTI